MSVNTSPIAQQSEVQKMVLYAFAADGTLAPATIGGGGGGTGTVTSVATSSPITGGPISTTGTIGCPTCTTNAAALTANALVIGGGLQATSALGSLGTTTTVLHGNAAGAPTFGAVNLATDVSGQLPISAVGSAGLSGTSPITISAAGVIGCATCNTSAATVTSASFTGGLISVATPTTTPAFTVAGTSGGVPYFSGASTWASSAAGTVNTLMKWGGAGNPPIASSITDNGTTVSTAELVTFSGVGAASTSPFLLNGTIFTGGSGTTTFPYAYLNFGAAPASFNTGGVLLGINAPSAFSGNSIETHLNGGGIVFSVGATGNVNGVASVWSGNVTGLKYNTGSNCSSAASPAVCGSSSAGSAVVAAATTTVVVNTTAVTANSIINVTEDSGLGTKLSVTCNTQSLLILGPPRVTARVVGTSFTVAVDVAPTTNPLCFNYTVIN